MPSLMNWWLLRFQSATGVLELHWQKLPLPANWAWILPSRQQCARTIIFTLNHLAGFVVTVAPDHKRVFERICGADAQLLGRVGGKNLRITSGKLLLDLPVTELTIVYKAPFQGVLIMTICCTTKCIPGNRNNKTINNPCDR